MKKFRPIVSNLRQNKRALIFIIAFTFFGTLLIIYSLAATPTANFEAESGSLIGNAQVVSDSAASGSSAVNFGVGSYGTCSGISVSPGEDLAALASNNSTGTTFCLNSGVYDVVQEIQPRSGQTFMAVEKRGAILTGNDTTPMAFDGAGISNVTIKGLVVEKFSPPGGGGYGAIKTSTNWVVEDNEVRGSHRTGVYIAAGVKLLRNYIHHNRIFGTGAYKAHGALIEGNEVAYNNADWPDAENSGGSKFSYSKDITIRGNHYHHNKGSGIWMDLDNLNVLIENNTANYQKGSNIGKGIHYEVSCAGVVRNNRTVGNEHSGIQVVASENVDVYGNHVEDNASSIRVWHQERTQTGTNCQWRMQNVDIHDNKIIMKSGHFGIYTYQVSDGDSIFSSTDDRLEIYDNKYVLDSLDAPRFWMRNKYHTFSQWQAEGNDVNGTATTN